MLNDQSFKKYSLIKTIARRLPYELVSYDEKKKSMEIGILLKMDIVNMTHFTLVNLRKSREGVFAMKLLPRNWLKKRASGIKTVLSLFLTSIRW